MARYLLRNCPRCADYLGLLLMQLPANAREFPILGICARCRYSWKLITGKQQPAANRQSVTRTLALIGSFLFLLSTLAFAGQYRTVKRVVDGDTLIMENGERVRLIGVDTPESVDPSESQAEILHNCKEVGAVAKMELCSYRGTI